MSSAGVAELLARLNDLTLDELRAEWRRLYRSMPPRLSQDLMRRAIAYRIQEKAFGGLKSQDGARPAWGRLQKAHPLRRARPGAGLHEEPFGLQAAVEIGNELAVAIEKLRRDAVVLADDRPPIPICDPKATLPSLRRAQRADL